jgi:hypothetical protein
MDMDVSCMGEDETFKPEWHVIEPVSDDVP